MLCIFDDGVGEVGKKSATPCRPHIFVSAVQRAWDTVGKVSRCSEFYGDEPKNRRNYV